LAIGVACFRSGAAVSVGPTDVSEGKICVVKNCVVRKIKTKISTLVPF
jgi:hypothetical protein